MSDIISVPHIITVFVIFKTQKEKKFYIFKSVTYVSKFSSKVFVYHYFPVRLIDG